MFKKPSSWSIIIHSSSSAIEHFIVDEDFFPLFRLYFAPIVVEHSDGLISYYYGEG